MSQRVKLDGDASGVVAANQQAAASAGKLDAGYKQAAKAAAALERQANKFTSTAVPAHKDLAQVIGKIKEKFDAGELSVDQYKRAVSRAKREMGGLGEKSKSAFSLSNLASIDTQTVAMQGMGRAIGFINEALEEQVRLKKEAAARDVTAAESMLQLQQAAATPAEFRELTGLFRELKMSGLDDNKLVKDIVIAMDSAGMKDQSEFVKKLAERGTFEQQELGQVVEAAAGLRKAIGAEEAGSLRDLVSKSIAASEHTEQAQAGAILKAAAGAGAAAVAQGISGDELIAAITVVSGTVGADRAETQVRGLLNQLSLHDEFRGRKLADVIPDLESRGLTPREMKDILKNDEALRGFASVAKSIDEFGETVADVVIAPSADLAGQRFDVSRGDPRVNVARETGLGERRLEGRQSELFGVRENVRKQVFQGLRQSPIGEAVPALAILSERMDDFMNRIGISPITWIQYFEEMKKTNAGIDRVGDILERGNLTARPPLIANAEGAP